MCYIATMKAYIHARLTREERALLDALKKATGDSDSDIVRRGLRLVHEATVAGPSALKLAGGSVGKFAKGPKTLSTDPSHLDGFGQ